MFTTATFSLIFMLLLVDTFNYEINSTGAFFSVGLSSLIGVGMGFYANMLFEMKESGIRRWLLEYEAENIKDEISEDIFENSIKMSYKYLDQYYLQTREQAQRGFFVTVCVAVFFYLYNRTVSSMSKYHNKLVLSQNISIALKIADTLTDEDKTKAKNAIIVELLKDVNSHLVMSDSENK